MADPQVLAKACAEAMRAADATSRDLGVELAEVRPGYARMRMRVTASMVNGHELCHGGYLFLLADTAFAYACNTYDEVTVAAACDIVFVTAAHTGEELVAEASERGRYGRSGLYDVTVTRAGDGAVVAEFRGRSRVIGGSIL